MTVSFPDVIGEYIDAPERYETSGVQYAGYFEPATIAPEQVTHLYLFLQNALNVPVTLTVKVEAPQAGGLLRAGPPILKVLEPAFQLKLASAEVGLLILPVTTEQAKEGDHALGIELKVSSAGRSQRIRPSSSQTKLGKGLIDSPVGLNLVGSLGAAFTTKSVKKANFSLRVAGPPDPPERAPQLKYSYQTIWTEKEGKFFNQAMQEVQQRQGNLRKELSVEALYVNLYAESTLKFADAGLPLRIGEAIILAKILTYSCHYFLSNPEMLNGLLVPMWERALAAEMDTTHTMDIIRSVGYYHLLKLAVAISFSLIAKTVGRQYWSLPERQAVMDYIGDKIETGQTMDEEFLYLPLLMAGACIADKVKLTGEDIAHSLALLKKARDARTYLFTDEDMAQADQICSQILNQVT